MAANNEGQSRKAFENKRRAQLEGRELFDFAHPRRAPPALAARARRVPLERGARTLASAAIRPRCAASQPQAREHHRANRADESSSERVAALESAASAALTYADCTATRARLRPIELLRCRCRRCSWRIRQRSSGCGSRLPLRVRQLMLLLCKLLLLFRELCLEFRDIARLLCAGALPSSRAAHAAVPSSCRASHALVPAGARQAAWGAVVAVAASPVVAVARQWPHLTLQLSGAFALTTQQTPLNPRCARGKL